MMSLNERLIGAVFNPSAEMAEQNRAVQATAAAERAAEWAAVVAARESRAMRETVDSVRTSADGWCPLLRCTDEGEQWLPSGGYSRAGRDAGIVSCGQYIGYIGSAEEAADIEAARITAIRAEKAAKRAAAAPAVELTGLAALAAKIKG